MRPDKKREELEQMAELELEKKLDQEEITEAEIVAKEETKKESAVQESAAEVHEAAVETEEEIEKRKKREVIFEMALFLILGILLGVTIKTEAVKRITIGFNDYLIEKTKPGYDIPALKKNLEQEMQAQQQAAQQSAPQTQQ